jgi:hypothetical protein
MASAGAIAAKLETGMKALKAAAERIKEAVPEAPALVLPEWRDADYERAEQMEALGQWMTGLANLVAPVAEPGIEVSSDVLESSIVTDAHGIPVAELPPEDEPDSVADPKPKGKKK